MGLLLVQSPVRSAGIAVMGSTIPLRRYHLARPGGLPNRPSRANGLVSAHAPLFEFRRPPGLFRAEASRGHEDPAPSLGFGPYDTCGKRGPVSTGFTCPPPSALRVWLPSRRFSPSRASPALFRAGSALGVRPSKPSPPGRLPDITAGTRPACRCRRQPRQGAEARMCRRQKPGCRVLPTESPLRIRRGFSPTGRRMLPWAWPFQGCSPPCLGRHFGPPPPSRLGTMPVTRQGPACASEFRSASG
jgi:hypothetical protein